MWLASVSCREVDGRIVPTEEWLARPALKNRGLRILKAILGPVGDKSRERVFRMNLTLCVHRVAGLYEISHLPSWWHTTPACGIAGPPVEVLHETEPSRSGSCYPCVNPRKILPDPSWDPRLWIPEGCGECFSCLARAEVRGG